MGRKQYREKKKEIAEKVRNCCLAVVIAILIGRNKRFRRWEFYGLFGDFEQKQEKAQSDLQKEVDCNGFTIYLDLWRGCWGGPKNGRNRMQIRKKGLSKKIELGLGFE